MLEAPVAGVHYPGSLADVRGWFSDDAACLDYLDWLRWREGFVCPHCESVVAWRLADGRWALDVLMSVRRILGDRDPSVALSDVVVLAKGSRFRHRERVCLGLAGDAVTCPKELCTLYINCATCDQLA